MYNFQTLRFYAILGPILLFGCGSGKHDSNPPIEIRPDRMLSVRFDPSYYYISDPDIKGLCRDWARQWKTAGLNAIYVKVYDPVHGAVYSTKHPLNIRTDYGNRDLLGKLIDACHREGLAVYAWFPAFQHKGAWEAHPEWRVKKPDHADYRPSSGMYPLCTRTQSFQEWWLGFVEELLEKYQSLDGVDLAEPIVTWRPGDGCACTSCEEAYGLERRKTGPGFDPDSVRSAPLTSIMRRTNALVRTHGHRSSVTTILTPRKDGTLLTSEQQRAMTGFDLNGILQAPGSPDIIQAELIWQQWASDFKDEIVFSPEWTEGATRRFIGFVDGRAQAVAHVEMTPFGKTPLDKTRLSESITAALEGRAEGIDFYDTHQADSLGLWPDLPKAFAHVPFKRIAVVYDPDGENDARQLAVLLRHFAARTELFPLEDGFVLPETADPEILFYLGVSQRTSLPAGFVRILSEPNRTVCWLNHNIDLLGADHLFRLGFRHEKLDSVSQVSIIYRDEIFPKSNPSLNRIHVTRPDSCRVLASAQSDSFLVPYAVRTGHFWYFADLPTAFLVEGDRHIVFADLLHDIVGEDHEENHLALVRIEDVNPESDPKSLRAIAGFLGGRHIPFSVGFTPFFLDPATNTAVSLSDRPETAKALRFMVSKGGTIVLHGCTHQYRGQTTTDYEFWDGLSDSPLFQDSREYVRERIEKGLAECFANRLFPMIWETPHYAASLLDYDVINGFFNTAYERRQTFDVSGTDQLFPFFIPSRDGKPNIIPENLGYIPLDDPSPEPMIASARRNRIVRDGFASFFFHPFVSIDVLKELVKGVQGFGYRFADVRTVDCRVTASEWVLANRRQDIRLEFETPLRQEWSVTPSGKITNRRLVQRTEADSGSQKIACPPGWTAAFHSLTDGEDGKSRPGESSGTGLVHRVRGIGRAPVLTPANAVARSLVVLDPDAGGKLAVDQTGFLRAFESVGIECDTVQLADFLEIPRYTNLLVLPSASAGKLSEQQILFTIGAVSKGMNLILEKESELSRRIGITPSGNPTLVRELQDEYYPQVEIVWKETDTVQTFDVSFDYVTYASDRRTGVPILIGSEYGEGKYLYMASLFDPTTTEGYGRFPYFLDVVQRQFGLWPGVKRETAEVYFEPGDREDVSVEDLVKMWKKNGFRTIHAAGWHVYDGWTYEYGRLIELAHQNAMRVFLWLELPHFNEKFWNAHPEWRERTASGAEAKVDWRRLMAVYEPSCREAVFKELSDMIGEHAWDGVNFAEMYFESLWGPDRPDLFTPMHPAARTRFRSLHGFDPVLLFRPDSPFFWKQNAAAWAQYQSFRKDLIVEIHRDFLSFLHRERDRKSGGFEIMATLIDDIHAKKTGEMIGSDSRRVIALSREFPFTLQIEDPQELWHMGPGRYEELSRTYREMAGESGLVLDINIVPLRAWASGLAPVRQPTGLELVRLIRSAGGSGNRVALYSESTMYEADFGWIAYAMASVAGEKISPTAWKIRSDHPVVVEFDRKKHRDVLVDGRMWPAYHLGRTLLPSGTHTIWPVGRKETVLGVFRTPLRLVDMSGDLLSCRMISRGIEVSYSSPTANWIVVNENPRRVIVDGEYVTVDAVRGIPGYSMGLPEGTHTVKIISRSAGLFSLKNISITFSFLIVILSSLAGLTLLFLYSARIRRRRKQNRKG